MEGDKAKKNKENEKFLKDVNQIKIWCDTLNMTPSQFFSTPEEELKLRLKNLKGRLRLNVAKNLIAYQKEKMDELERKNAALRRAHYSEPNETEDYYQEGYEEGWPIPETQIYQSKLQKEKDQVVNASNGDSVRKKAGDNIDEKKLARLESAYLGNTAGYAKCRVRGGDNKLRSNNAWDILCNACSNQPKIEDESLQFTDAQRPQYRPPRRESLPSEDITGSSFDDCSYGIRGFQEYGVCEPEVYGEFQPCPIKQSTPKTRMRARPVYQAEDTWKNQLAEESVNYSDPYEGSYTLGERCPCPANRIYNQSTTFGTHEESYEDSYDQTGGTYDVSGGTYDASGGTYDASGGTYDASGGTYDMSGRYDSPCPSSPNRTSDFECSGQREFDAVFPPPGGRNPPRRAPVCPRRSPSPPSSPVCSPPSSPANRTTSSGQAQYDAYFPPPRPRCPISPQSPSGGSTGRSRTMSSSGGCSRASPNRTFDSCGMDSTYNTTNTRSVASSKGNCPRNRSYNSYGAATRQNVCSPNRTC